MTTAFDNKPILDAFYTNEANDTIEVLYRDDDAQIHSVYVPATDPAHYMMKALFERGFTTEKIVENTISRKRLESALWTQAYKRYAAEEVKVVKAEYQAKLDEIAKSKTDHITDVLGAVMTHNADQDMLFKAKLAIFDMPEIKTLKDRNIKQAIRTSKTFIQLFAALNDALK